MPGRDEAGLVVIDVQPGLLKAYPPRRARRVVESAAGHGFQEPEFSGQETGNPEKRLGSWGYPLEAPKSLLPVHRLLNSGP